MRGWNAFAAAALAALVLTSQASAAAIAIVVDKTKQRMTVSVDGQERYVWPVSTGMGDYATPTGAFAPSRLARTHFSREWDNAPMPHSIFFTDAGHAIHGSRATGRLGMPASHGCVRLAPMNASILFNLVAEAGTASTKIEIVGVEPIGSGFAGGDGPRGDYSRLTSFDPLTSGIMAGGDAPRRRSEARPTP
jgi:hypothetical protein